MFEVKKIINWKYPPTTNRSGVSRHKHDIKSLMLCQSDLFKVPIIIMSDIHQHTPDVVRRLVDTFDLSKFVVLTAGDMAGKGIFGSDGDPTESYEMLNKFAREFYFVQGNHDLPHPEKEHRELINHDNSKCAFKNGEHKISFLVGKIGGVNGIISNKKHPYKSSKAEYCNNLKRCLKRRLNVLMIHDTPKLPLTHTFTEKEGPEEPKVHSSVSEGNYIGNEDIFKLIDQYKPRICIYGHCHHPTVYNQVGKVNYLNVDSRILVVLRDSDKVNEYLQETSHGLFDEC